MKKISNITMLFLLVIQLFAPMFNASEIKSVEQPRDSSCFTYDLTANQTTVASGTQAQFNFSFESVTPACSPSDITGEQIIIDLSPLVADGSAVSVSTDGDIFDVNVSDTGVVTLTFKDLSSTGETLVGFGGNAVITVTVKHFDEDTPITITDNVGDEVVIDVNGSTEANTNKVSDIDYVEVGSVITYSVLINGNGNNVDSFHGVDSAGSGLAYVPGSFSAEVDNTWEDVTSNFTPSIDSDGHLVIDSNGSFNQPILLHYQMTVTDQQETYTNAFTATYDGTEETISDDVYFDMEGGHWVDYTHGNIEITKTDEEGNVLAGAEFDILDSSGSVVDHVVTDSTGVATSSNLPLGNYTVVETEAPNGYILDSTPHAITITADDSDMIFELNVTNELALGKIQITKTNESGEVLPGAEFDILDSSGSVVEHVVTNESGIATTTDLPIGDYTAVETKAPNGYILDSTPHAITITADDSDMIFELNVTNELALGKIQITKTDENGDVLSGAEFDILDGSGNVVDHVVTNDEGVAESIKLPVGTYSVQETVAPEGYVLDSTPHDITITADDSDMMFELNITNALAVGNLKITKVDENGDVLSGAEFDILDSGGSVVDHIVTNESGVARTKDLPLGTYYAVETVAPTGFVLDPTQHEFTITTNGEIISLEVENQKTSANIELDKVDQDQNPLAGAEFTIYNADGETVETLKTDSSGHAESKQLPLGTYSVKETKAPIGYDLNTKEYTADLSENGETVSLNKGKPIINQLITGQLEIHKTGNQGQNLQGAEYTIYDQDGNVIEVLTTGKDGKAKSSNLPYGKYYVVETKAPTGYNLDSTKYEFMINSNGAIVKYEMVNQIIQGQVEVAKVDENNVPLAGAEFTIYNKAEKSLETITTDSDGHAISSKLDYGDYYLVETKAPVGYKLSSTKYPFTISNQNQIVEVNNGDPIVNYQLPSTIVDDNKGTPTNEEPKEVSQPEITSSKPNTVIETLSHTGSKIVLAIIGLLLALVLILGIKRYTLR